MTKVAVLIGHFQPLCNSQQKRIERLLKKFETLVIVIGSANQYPSSRNPWTATEREQMIKNSFHETERAKLKIVHADDDHHNEMRWQRRVRHLVQEHTQPNDNIHLVAVGAAINANKNTQPTDEPDLKIFADWNFYEDVSPIEVSEKEIRDHYFSETKHYQNDLPMATQEHLKKFKNSATFARLQQEWKTIKDLQVLEKNYPYPITHVTVDALVLCADHILLIERNGPIGQGAWAMPGGYLDKNETTLEAAVRELHEETGLLMLKEIILTSHAFAKLFDLPCRSSRGHAITQVHAFVLPNRDTPTVQGEDDAGRAFWLPIESLFEHRAKFHDDHFQIIRFVLENLKD